MVNPWNRQSSQPIINQSSIISNTWQSGRSQASKSNLHSGLSLILLQSTVLSIESALSHHRNPKILVSLTLQKLFLRQDLHLTTWRIKIGGKNLLRKRVDSANTKRSLWLRKSLIQRKNSRDPTTTRLRTKMKEKSLVTKKRKLKFFCINFFNLELARMWILQMRLDGIAHKQSSLWIMRENSSWLSPVSCTQSYISQWRPQQALGKSRKRMAQVLEATTSLNHMTIRSDVVWVWAK